MSANGNRITAFLAELAKNAILAAAFSTHKDTAFFMFKGFDDVEPLTPEDQDVLRMERDAFIEALNDETIWPDDKPKFATGFGSYGQTSPKPEEPQT